MSGSFTLRYEVEQNEGMTSKRLVEYTGPYTILLSSPVITLTSTKKREKVDSDPWGMSGTNFKARHTEESFADSTTFELPITRDDPRVIGPKKITIKVPHYC